MTILLRCTIVFLCIGFFSDSSSALPRFAARTGAKCQSCHVNPSGGGMRQAFGQQYGRETLPVPTWSQELDLEEFTTKLSEFVSIGADMRSLFFVQQTPTGSRNDFFLMQTDLYFNLKIAKKFSLYLSHGMRDRFEAYGLFTVLPAKGSLKFGKFEPNYGMRLDDHRSYIREKTGFSPQFARSNEYVGGEASFAPGPMTITAGIYNSPSGISGPTMLGRVEGLFEASENTHVWIGANAFTRKAVPDMRVSLLGAFGGISFGDFTILGEADLIRSTGLGTSKDSTGVVTYLEADYVITPGVDLKFGWDFFDPDKDVKSGSVSKYSVGLEFFPIQGVEVRPVYRFVVDDPNDINNNEFNLLVHFYL